MGIISGLIQLLNVQFNFYQPQDGSSEVCSNLAVIWTQDAIFG